MADSDLTQWSVAAETKEWVGPITVTVDAVPTTSFEVTLTGPGARPLEWAAPTVLDGGRGLLIGDGTDFTLSPGQKYALWIRYTDTPEVPVQKIGIIKAY